MTTIIVTHEDNEIDEFGFDASDQIISIGRRSSNDVCIPNLSVSGVHARVTIDGDSALIEDNNSTNGTYINGRLISRQLLNENDEIVIGKTRVTVRLSTHTAEPPTLNAVQTEPAATNPSAAVLLNDNAELDQVPGANTDRAQSSAAQIAEDDFDDSYVGEPSRALNQDHYDERPMTLSEKAKLALGRESMGRESNRDSAREASAAPRNGLKSVAAAGIAATSASAAANRAFSSDTDTAVAEAPASHAAQQAPSHAAADEAHPLDGLEDHVGDNLAEPSVDDLSVVETSGSEGIKHSGAVIEIQNGAKSGQVLPIDKPVTTLGRPGIQIAAIMRKPDGYFLMHIESDDSVDMPTLNRDTIGDDPVMLHSGDRLNVAGIDVEFMLS